ncbi:hypothetical protein GCM10008967_31640 [Bacillus carboniphilus]|uniref:LysM domain-containing protein n=1 Tax=Bacillus carboniphilus TaxID=86663 RepID=A0ABN0WIK7_9BACI
MTTFIKKHSFSILFLLFAWILAFVYIQLTAETSADNYQSITINKGDTLWEIASTYQEEANHSIQSFIAWVEDMNNIDVNSIKPGDQIVIPVEKYGDIQYLASSGE